jgi:hypothetical protein
MAPVKTANKPRIYSLSNDENLNHVTLLSSLYQYFKAENVR